MGVIGLGCNFGGVRRSCSACWWALSHASCNRLQVPTEAEGCLGATTVGPTTPVLTAFLLEFIFGFLLRWRHPPPADRGAALAL